MMMAQMNPDMLEEIACNNEIGKFYHMCISLDVCHCTTYS
jgi:hypothetical protein